MSYTKVGWKNNTTALSEDNLNHMDNQIFDNNENIERLSSRMSEVEDEVGRPATSTKAGAVKPDGVTTRVLADGTLTAIYGGGGGASLATQVHYYDSYEGDPDYIGASNAQDAFGKLALKSNTVYDAINEKKITDRTSWGGKYFDSNGNRQTGSGWRIYIYEINTIKNCAVIKINSKSINSNVGICALNTIDDIHGEVIGANNSNTIVIENLPDIRYLAISADNDVAPEVYDEIKKFAQLTEKLSEVENNEKGIIGGDKWVADKTYAVNDCCIYNNTIYICKAINSNVAPPNIDYWEEISFSTLNSKINTEKNKIRFFGANATNKDVTIKFSGTCSRRTAIAIVILSGQSGIGAPITVSSRSTIFDEYMIVSDTAIRAGIGEIILPSVYGGWGIHTIILLDEAVNITVVY